MEDHGGGANNEGRSKSRSVTVYQGTCGWTGQQLSAWRGQRPSPSGESKKPLATYARFWPAVEVNSSSYAVPSQDAVENWCDTVKSGEFRFTFKAFSLFTHRQVDPKALPAEVKVLLSATQLAAKSVTWEDLRKASALDVLWQIFNDSLLVAYKRSTTKLAVIAVFQFGLAYAPNVANLRHVEECRRRLDSRLAMAVEFRDRSWFIGDAKERLKLIQRLRDRGIALVSADELLHETFPNTQTGATHAHKVLPISTDVTSREFAYIRVHRRTGFEDRRLSEMEICRWRDRVLTIASQLDDGGCIFVFWGTEHRNEPLTNGANLAKALQNAPGLIVAPPVRSHQKEEDKGSITRFFPFMGIVQSTNK